MGSNSSAGNYIRIRTDSRTVMVYYHLKNKSSLKKGALVATGQVIGYMGKTGNATGPHLHWGIQLDGKWVDPEAYLDADWVSYKQVSVKVKVMTSVCTMMSSASAMPTLKSGCVRHRRFTFAKNCFIACPPRRPLPAA